MSNIPFTYFASGSNHAGEIEGFTILGAPLGVAVHELNEESLAALEATATIGVPVFVDSGAFSEVEANFPGDKRYDASKPIGLNVVEPITADEWNRRLAIYKRLAVALGGQLYPVAPDLVGNQAATLERLATYADDVRELRELGARIIVPLQGSPDGMSLAEMDARVCDILGFDDYVRGIPSNKAPASVESIVDLVTSRECCKAVHLLGVGPKAGDKFLERLEGIHAARADVEILCDAVLITSMTGKGRALTEAQRSHWFDELAPDAFHDETYASYTDDVDEIDAWMGPAMRKRFADELIGLGLASESDRKAIIRSPEAWMHEEDDEGYSRWNDWTSQIVDGFFVGRSTAKNNGYYFDITVVVRKREGIVRACGDLYDAEGRWAGGYGRASR
jgi:hypothetical protein